MASLSSEFNGTIAAQWLGVVAAAAALYVGGGGPPRIHTSNLASNLVLSHR